MINSAYLADVVDGLTQDAAYRSRQVDIGLGLQTRMRELGLLVDGRSRFLVDRAARVITSTRGSKMTLLGRHLGQAGVIDLR